MRLAILDFRFSIGRHLLPLLLIGSSLMGQTDSSRWHVLIEPKFMRPPVSFPIPGAESTLFVPGWIDGDGVHYFSKEAWEKSKLDWDLFRQKSAGNATDKKISVEFARDSKEVIQYATLTSESPLTSTMVLSPDFLTKFSELFGPKLLVAIPNRFTVFIFPSLATKYKDYAAMILDEYHNASYPVSLEVFEISKDGLRAIGTFED